MRDSLTKAEEEIYLGQIEEIVSEEYYNLDPAAVTMISHCIGSMARNRPVDRPIYGLERLAEYGSAGGENGCPMGRVIKRILLLDGLELRKPWIVRRIIGTVIGAGKPKVKPISPKKPKDQPV